MQRRAPRGRARARGQASAVTSTFVFAFRTWAPRVAAPITRDERDDWPVTADEDERLHDLIETTPDGCSRIRGGRCSVRELLDARFGPRIAEEGGHPLDGLPPGRYHRRSLPSDESPTQIDRLTLAARSGRALARAGEGGSRERAGVQLAAEDSCSCAQLR